MSLGFLKRHVRTVPCPGASDSLKKDGDTSNELMLSGIGKNKLFKVTGFESGSFEFYCSLVCSTTVG